ncbi:uncharacterized protein LOC118466244 isoform X1 [Anopheles albimanus]|uniref:uncharacterized protein LOC118466244 isoform X1 n=1 Tax=Anopheles albimanus TaxID=7167 RepID=UPI00163E8DD8|nr:uncharacterized protein LOC118466244 isoform X1 [Anopheles albimanus]
MIDQQPKLPYFPMEMKCNVMVAEARSSGGRQDQEEQALTSEPGANIISITSSPSTTVSNERTNNMATTGTTITSCSAKTPITTSMASSQQQHMPPQHPQLPPPPPASGSPAADGGRIMLVERNGAENDANGVNGVPATGGPDGGLVSLLAGSSLCGQCCSPICDRYIMKVVDSTYHERCLQCTSCSIRLMHSCFMRDGKLYCRFDYERLYGRNRCLGCGEKIGADELVMRALDNVFHLKCFICVVCGVRLQKGDQYVIKQSQLFCRPDYEKEVEMFQGYSYAGCITLTDDYCCDDMFQTRIDGRRGPKRPRTILTTQQRRAFKASFDISPKPCRKIREGLAKDTGLSIRIVQVWFQNQRAKMKKIQKKQLKDGSKNAHHGGAGGGTGAGTKNHNGSSSKGHDSQEELSDTDGGKLALRIKDENSRSNNYLHDSCSDNEGTVTDNDGTYGGAAARLIGAGPDPFKIVKEELDFEEDYFRLAMSHHHPPHGAVGARYTPKSFANDHHHHQQQHQVGGCSGIIKTENMALDTPMVGSSSSTTTMDYHGVPLQQLAATGGSPQAGATNAIGPSGHQTSHEALPPMLNPIDRLYSMQNSYFCNQENPHLGGTTPPNGTAGNHRGPAPLQQHQMQNQMHLQQQQQQQCPVSMSGTGGPTMMMPHVGGQHHHFASSNPQHIMPLSTSNANQMSHHVTGLCGNGLEQQQQQQAEGVM